ncbi:MAG: hypothetical protein K8Q89_08415 [Nitrosarchaeum sp.]|nr:hypothetical protein [Nitrosarchaeum sp.]
MITNTTKESTIQTTRMDNDNDNDNVLSLQARIEEENCKLTKYTHNRTQIGSRIRTDVIEEFKCHVIKKHGKLRKGFETELEIALIEYNNSRRKHQQTASLTIYSGKMVRSDVMLKLNQIKKEFQGIGSYPNFSPESIKKALHRILGEKDKRTFTKYLNMIRKNSKVRSTSFGLAVIDITRFCESVPEEFLV